jgi:hypothetical protein
MINKGRGMPPFELIRNWSDLGIAAMFCFAGAYVLVSVGRAVSRFILDLRAPCQDWFRSQTELTDSLRNTTQLQAVTDKNMVSQMERQTALLTEVRNEAKAQSKSIGELTKLLKPTT